MPTAPMVCHVLLIETDNGLVLVDSGYGTDDCTDPKRVGPTRHPLRAILSHEETVAHQIEQLGFSRDDMRHIVITHLDVGPRRRTLRLPSAAGPRNVRGSAWCHQGPLAAREGSLPLRAMGARTQHRRARSAGREVARVRRCQGTHRDLARHCARFASRPHPRARVRGCRCRPPMGAARRRRVLSLRHPRRNTGAASADGDGDICCV